MKRITVTLPDELVTLIDRERRRRDVSAATVIRDAIAAQIQSTNGSPSEARRELSIVGLGCSRDREFTAATMEDYFAQEHVAESMARESGLSWGKKRPSEGENAEVEDITDAIETMMPETMNAGSS
jgi:Arc/MetJ-type ribon-helix-helix transcriptional regulator